MEIREVLITPQIAAKLLRDKGPNRGLSEATVQVYVHALKSGNFTLTPGGISLGIDGRLRDGQHRMEAIVRSGISARFMVHTKCSESELANIDQGRSRSVADALKIATQDLFAHNKAAVISLAVKVGTGGNVRTTSTVYTYVATHFGESMQVCNIPRAKIAAPGLLALAYAYPLDPPAILLLRSKMAERSTFLTQQEISSVFPDGKNRNKALETIVGLLGSKKDLHSNPREASYRIMRGVKAFLLGESLTILKKEPKYIKLGYQWLSNERKTRGLLSLRDMIPEALLKKGPLVEVVNDEESAIDLLV